MGTPLLEIFLIGADTLLMECGALLLDQGHTIRGVVSDSARVAAWCLERGLELIDPAGDYEAALARQPFDVLFAITHLAIVPDDVLELPRRAAVNFHDGPLPRYAGLNAPVWALLAGESRYGVTWHTMTAGVDEGDILEQVTFDVADDETALSLNTRCMAAALESFPRVVDALARGTETRTPQDLAERTVFLRHDRPDAACLVDWTAPAERVDAFVRALAHGPYPNPVGLPKTGVEGGEPFVVDAVRVVGGAEGGDGGPALAGGTPGAGRAGEAGGGGGGGGATGAPSVSGAAGAAGTAGDAEPGRVVAVEDGAVLVAVADGRVAITAARDLAGETLDAEALAGRFGARPGARLLAVDGAVGEALGDADRRLRRVEGFWTRRLREAEPAVLPHAGTAAATPEPSEVEVPFPGDVRERWGERADDALRAAWAVALARTGRRERFDLGFAAGADAPGEGVPPGWYAPVVPLRVELDPAASFDAVVDALASATDRARRKGTFLRDLALRDPGIAPAAARGAAFPDVGMGALDDGSAPPSALAWLTPGPAPHIAFDAARLAPGDAAALAGAVGAVLAAAAEAPEGAWTGLPLLPAERRADVVEGFNRTSAAWSDALRLHDLVEAQVDRTPDAVAVVASDATLTYRELDARANRLAHHLRELGVGPDALVGVHVGRTTDLPVAALAVLKAGGAYLPLDPDLPADRIRFMMEDAGTAVVITEGARAGVVEAPGVTRVRLDDEADALAARDAARPEGGAGPGDLAYAIYTSGSTGTPKGVLVEHRNVVSFVAGMDAVVPHDPPGVWLAVTSLSFDISVLELFWTLARGFEVVVHADGERAGPGAAGDRAGAPDPAVAARPMDFGLFMWGNDDGPGPEKYRLMMEGARYFDANGFDSVWTPERHFHAFGGPFPNPSVTGAALAAVTERIAIRSGSCVSPLHHPIRIAEEWAVVDNLSGGRVGLSFAAGWQPNDFVIRPQSFPDSKAVMLEQIDIVRRLWRGEAVEFESPKGGMVPVVTLPRPVQPELPFWVTTAGNPASYEAAGAMGANVLTHLLGQTVDEVADKIARYRRARADAGHDPDAGHVTLMLHAFVGENDDRVRELVREPMKDYLRASMKLVLGFAWSFPAFKRPGGPDASPADVDLKSLSPDETEAILDFAFERYFEGSGLFGTPETCLAMVDRCKAAGVDEIACLLDYGVDTDRVMESLPLLKRVRDEANRVAEGATGEVAAGRDAGAVAAGAPTLASRIRERGVTHLQCTPSMARLILADADARAALAGVRHLFLGGEALPPALVAELRSATDATITNMYGPTETTIWSSTHRVGPEGGDVPIGRPIANTRMYVLDRWRGPVPPGVPGDLYIAGPGVTRGYHRRPELTERRFPGDPFHGNGDRMYWTGDLARWRDDGTLDFLGRVDHQVKVRGYRIELGEIEAALEGVPGVRSAAVLVREDRPGDQRLVAYVVADGGWSEAGAREALRERLPDYMVPRTFVRLARMPLTPSGKIDRRALPGAAEAAGPAASEGVGVTVLPEGELESAIAACWRSTLGRERVGASDNFFDVGGHSLLVVRLHRELSDALPHIVSLVDLYRFPTIRSLAGHLGNEAEAPTAAHAGVERARQRRTLGRRRRS